MTLAAVQQLVKPQSRREPPGEIPAAPKRFANISARPGPHNEENPWPPGRSYPIFSARPPAELPLLFQRILQNGIRDHFRRQKVRSTWTTALANLGLSGEDDDADPLETLE